jgi:hypothetical protein
MLGAAALLAGAATMLAACGTAHAPGAGGRAVSDSGETASSQLGAPAGSRTAALALTSRLFSRLSLPQGARLTQPRTLPAALRQPGAILATGTDSVDVHRVFTVHQSLTATQHYLMAHPPAGMRLSGTGRSSAPTVVPPTPVPIGSPAQPGSMRGGALSALLDWSLRTLPAGIEMTDLTVTLVPAAGGSSLVRADAQVTWYPPRTAAEHLNASAIRNLGLSVEVLNPRPHTVRRTVTSHSVIMRLVTLLNSLHAAPRMVLHCPAIMASYRVTLLVSAPGGRPLQSVTATPDGCGTDTFWASGKAQPPLDDPQSKLTALVDGVLGVKSAGGIRGLPTSPMSK